MNRRLNGDCLAQCPYSQRWRPRHLARPTGRRSSEPGADLARDRRGNHSPQSIGPALTQLTPRERRILEARRLADRPRKLEELASEFGYLRNACASSRCAPLRKFATP